MAGADPAVDVEGFDYTAGSVAVELEHLPARRGADEVEAPDEGGGVGENGQTGGGEGGGREAQLAQELRLAAADDGDGFGVDPP